MRKLLCLTLSGLLAISACKKGELLKGDNGCITQFHRRSGISASDSIAAVNLFKANGIPYANLVFDRVTLDDTVTNVNSHVTSVYQHIEALQYANGLPILNAFIGYHFVEGKYFTTIGTKYNAVNLGTTHKLNLAQVRQLFLKAAGVEADKMKDTCLSAEFGYYDLTHDREVPDMVKAWHVTPANNIYSEAFIRDDNATVISYFDGIYTFK